MKKTAFPLWWTGKMPGVHLLPGAPPGAKVSPDSKLTADKLGKVPCKLTSGGWVGFADWTSFEATLEDVKRWHKWGANVLYQTRVAHAIDIDVDDEATAAAIEAEFKRLFGTAPVRFREGSSRRLMLTAIADGETPLRKRRIKFRIRDKEHAVELLGVGQQCVVEGKHPKGGVYQWRGGHPCALGLAKLPAMTKLKADEFFTGVAEYLDLMGYEVVASASADNKAGTRQGLDNPALHAPSPELVLAALEKWRPDDMGHDEYVQALAAIKAALGPRRDEFKGEVLAWSPGVRSTEDDQFEIRWNSIRDSSLGWSWLSGEARAHGFTEDAQQDFDDAPQADGSPADPNAAIPETPYDRMLKRYVWVKNLGQYNDTHDGSFLDSKTFNASNVDVKPFGSSGQQSAEATFLNAEGARKVATATSRPGQPGIIQEANNCGIPVSAVNLWRPSSVKPDMGATPEDVAPWLDLVGMLFGSEGAPEREHFLDFLAFVLQYPGEKIGHALVIIGGQGVGKDTVLKPFFEAVGAHNVAAIDTDTLFGQWTYFLKAQIVYPQEVITYGRRGLYNKIKPYISAQLTRLVVNEKNVRQYTVPNNQNWIVTTNHDNALALEDDDRRFWIHRSLIEEPPANEFFAKLHGWLKIGGTEKIFGWLKQRDLSSFNPMAKPPITAAKRTMLEASLPKPVRYLREQLREGGPFAHRTVFTAEELMNTTNDDWGAQAPLASLQHAIAALRGEGFKSAHRVRLQRFGMRTLWARGLDGKTTPDAMRGHYEQESDGAR